jgi:hypothetical protein
MQQLCHIESTAFIICPSIQTVLLIWVAPLAETSRKVCRLVLVLSAMWVEEQKATPEWIGRESMSLTTEMVKLKIRLSRSRPWRHTGSWMVIAPLILTLGTSWMWVVNFTPRQLHSREEPSTNWIRGWMGRRVGRPLHSREEPGTNWIRGWMVRTVGLDCYGEEEIFFPHQDLNPVPFGPYLAAIPTTLSRLGTRQMSRELRVYSSNEATVYKMRAITRTHS